MNYLLICICSIEVICVLQCSGQNFSVFVKKMWKIIHVFGDFCANLLFVCALTMESCLFSCLSGLQPYLIH